MQPRRAPDRQLEAIHERPPEAYTPPVSQEASPPAPSLWAPPAIAPAPASHAMAPPATTIDVDALRDRWERPLFIASAIVSGVAWLALVISLVGILYGAIGLTFMLVAHALFLAHVKGNAVLVSERQLPDLYARASAAAGRLGMARVPDIYLMQSNGFLNAFATKLLSRRFVIIYSSLVDACTDPRQLDFVIGHELGHLAAGHLAWNAFLAPARLMPLLGPAYSRAREYTCDRCGLSTVGDLEQSMRGLAVLAAGGKHAPEVNLAAFEEQRMQTSGFWMSALELASSHPYLCKRAAALRDFTRPGSVEPVSHNALAYVFAPFFAVGQVGGAFAVVIWLAIAFGVLDAIEHRLAADGRGSSAAHRYDEPSSPWPFGTSRDNRRR